MEQLAREYPADPGLPDAGRYARRPRGGMQPVSLYVGDPHRPVFLRLHVPARGGDVGVVIVPPFGHEAICCWRSLRSLAVQAAQCGSLVAQLDLDGTGDSAGSDLDPGRVEAWCDSVQTAADLLRARGASRLVFVGLRLGATLAVLAAARRRDVAGIVAIAPVVSGRKWLREMDALQSTLRSSAPQAATPAADSARNAGGGVTEIAGFALTAATRNSILATDLLAVPVRCPAVMVVDRHDLPPSADWIDRLREAGAEVDARRLPGYAEMMLDAHKAEIPQQMLAATLEFVTDCPRLAGVPEAVDCTTRVMARFEATACLEEIPVELAGGLRGILTRPAGRRRTARALLLLNAGGVRRIGPNRLYVTAARALAARGHITLRLDVSGTGDSPARPGLPDNQPFHAGVLDDIRVAVRWMQENCADQIVLGGLCSGGYHAHAAALAGVPVVGTIVINPGLPEDASYARMYRSIADSLHFRRIVDSGGFWKKLRSTRVGLRRGATVVLRRALDVVLLRLRNALGRLGFRLQDDLGAELRALARSGIHPSFIFGSSEPIYELFRRRAGRVPQELVKQKKMRVRVLDGPDHTFSARWTHELFLRELVRAMEWDGEWSPTDFTARLRALRSRPDPCFGRLATEPVVKEAGYSTLPRWFGPADRPLLGWWTARPGRAAGRVVIVLPPLGYEYWSSHRTLRTFAERLAAAGNTVLRIDYDGTGDSAGERWDADRVVAWRRSVVAAVAEARALGATRVVLAGVRFGATLALLEAADLDVEAVVAWAPVVTGRHFARELRMLGRVIQPTEQRPDPQGAVVYAGVVFTRTTACELAGIDLAAPARRPAPRVLLVARPESGCDELAAGMERAGAAVTLQTLPGSESALDVPAEGAAVPQAIVDAMVGWIGPPGETAPLPVAAPRRAAVIHWHNGSLREHVVTLGPTQLAGVLGEPCEGARDTTVVFLNSGSDPHVGPARCWTEYCRELNLLGFRTVRADFSGWGESPDLGHHLGRPYDQRCIDEALAVVAALRANGHQKVVLAGLCAGAWIAMQAALRGSVDAVVAINPQLYWKRGDPLDARMSDTLKRRERARRWESLGARLHLWDALDTLGVTNHAGRWLSGLVQARVPVLMLFGEDDEGYLYLRNRLDRRLRAAQESDLLWLWTIADIDHPMYSEWRRPEVFGRIVQYLESLAVSP